MRRLAFGRDLIGALLGDFALTATAIAEQVGIITTPLHAIKHLSDLPYDKPPDEIPDFNADKEKGDLLTSLVLSGPEMNTMTESQWKQVLTVSSARLWFVMFRG